MVEAINPLNNNAAKISELAQPASLPNAGSVSSSSFSGNVFDDVLNKAITALNNVSQSETYANEQIQKYVKGEAELEDVLLAQSKASIMVQLAVTTVNSAVTSFKELTQMQI